MTGSRIPKFYKLSVEDRLQVLYDRGVLNEADYRALASGTYILDAAQADRLTENVIGVFPMPMGLGLNFQINARDYLVPMVVEEPSIIAAVSSAARLVRRAGGFESVADQPLLIGQVQVLDVAEPELARHALLQRKADILAVANEVHPNMVARGGGAKDVEVFLRGATAEHGELLVVHLLVDSRDAMGANLVNTMCEAVAPLVEAITGSRVYLRILSNLTDRAMVRATAVIPVDRLKRDAFSGVQVRDGIILANEFAAMDPYRAATHNKGIMNGIDAVAIATGNDWRAIEAAAHAFAGRGGQYGPLTSWYADDDGNLVGELEIPLKVGTVGGQVESNPAVRIAHGILGVSSAGELAEVMAAVGLAQNLAALKALSTEGIQPGHMRLHARSVAVAAGASGSRFDEVVTKLVASGEIKIWKARRIIETLGAADTGTGAVNTNTIRVIGAVDARAVRTGTINVVSDLGALGSAGARPEPLETTAARTPQDRNDTAIEALEMPVPGQPQHIRHRDLGGNVGYGKIILFGEHSVVYGYHAIAAPIGLSIRADVSRRDFGTELVIAEWDRDAAVRDPVGVDVSRRMAALIASRLGVGDAGMRVEVFPHLPRASGLGASAALAVAVIRAVSECFDIRLDDDQISRLAFECEEIVHGTPSGVDNTIATFGRPILFRKSDAQTGNEIRQVVTPSPIPIVIGLTGVRSLTARTVSIVRTAWQQNPRRYENIFAQIDALALEGADALTRGDIAELGELMNINQGLLNALQVSSPELETLVDVARNAGALGAKLTGGGGGGAMIAIAQPDATDSIAAAMRAAGYVTYLTQIR